MQEERDGPHPRAHLTTNEVRNYKFVVVLSMKSSTVDFTFTESVLNGTQTVTDQEVRKADMIAHSLIIYSTQVMYSINIYSTQHHKHILFNSYST